jgi:ribonucleoside-diphosphate reductase alpha chain
LSAAFACALSRRIWEQKYRLESGRRPPDREPADTWRRVARALAQVEPGDRRGWAARFEALLADLRFLPGGRILAGAGSGRRVTLFNCFVMGLIEDSMTGILDGLKEGALTMQQGGGVGYDFSTLRPAGIPARGVGTRASGPVSFMRVWDSLCATILSSGARRGAMMATLRCDHPDIEAFVAAKGDPRELRHFNLSVQVSDAFLEAVDRHLEWPLVFPAAAIGPGEDAPTVRRPWTGSRHEVECRVMRTVRARDLWDRIMRATYEYAEPGVLFVDTINRENNLWYCEHITATNPCGEIPLPPYGACVLGSVNLARFVTAPYSPGARLDLEGVARTAALATRLLDDVIDASRFPLRRQAEAARGSRRIGLGLTGLGDALLMLGQPYEGDTARSVAAEAARTVMEAAYEASCGLAEEKGPFPRFRPAEHLEGAFIRRLPARLRDRIARHGIRNSHLTAIAPAGTISLLADNVSSGLEPVFDLDYERAVRTAEGGIETYRVRDYAARVWREGGGRGAPPAFRSAYALSPHDHLAMQAAVQPFVDNAISKTINVAADCDFATFRSVYERAHTLGLKGCTTFRPNPVSGSVLAPAQAAEGEIAAQCCGPGREPE